MAEAIATCKQGRLEGIDQGGVLAFHGVPYASDDGRFRRALPPEPWEGVREAKAPSPIFPQQSRAIVVPTPDGTVELPQEEDAFRLNIWTPSTEGSHPVMFWIHGGGYSSGGCAFPCYHGTEIARNGDVVFVGVNYRLGALGNLHLPGVTDDNLAVYDLMSAFEWVRQNIEAFGGNPDCITVIGQSAGAWYAMALAGQSELKGQIARLALMSFPGSQPLSEDDADDLAASLLRHLKATDPQQIFDKPVKKILDAQRKAACESKHFGISFMPYADGSLLESDFISQAVRVSGSTVPLLDGVTVSETAFFLSGMHDAIENMDESGVYQLLSGFCEGQDVRTMVDQCKSRGETRSRYDMVIDLTTELLFREAGDQLASEFDTAYAYRLGYKSNAPWLGACHCMDMPFVFGNLESWIGDPMMEGADLDQMRPLSKKMQAAFVAFARTGSTACDEIPDWGACKPGGGIDRYWFS